MLQQRPALRLVLLFTSGILSAQWIFLPLTWLYFIAFILVLFSVILFVFNTWKAAGELSLQCSVILLGLYLQTIQRSHFYSHRLEPAKIDERAVFFGSADSEPSIQERKISFVMKIDSVVRSTRIERETGRIMVILRLNKNEKYDYKIKVGDEFSLKGTVEPFPFQRNPGEYDYGKYLELNDIRGFVSAKSLSSLKIEKQTTGSPTWYWIYSVQRSLYHIIDAFHSRQNAGFLKGIIFGYRGDISTEVKQSFIDTGTIHILAVSGSNVAFVALVFFSLLGFFRLPRKAVIITAILGLLVYMLISGSSSSVVRATIMAIVLICGNLFERKADIYNSISVAALVLLLWNSNNLYDVGFQLSFAAVISIVYLYPKLELLIKKIPERFEEIKAIDLSLKLLAVSLAAQIGTIPFTIYYFGRISIISLLANIPVVPISGLNTFIGAAEIFFSPISTWIARIYAVANDFLVWFLLNFVKQASNVPFAYFETSHLPAAAIVGYYIFVICIFNLNRIRIRALLIIFLLVVGNYLIFNSLWFNKNTKLIVTVIDVGQGDAILLNFPNGKNMLVDTGSLSFKNDAGERIIVPLLKKEGISKIDYMLITHPHSDHLGGAQSILRSIDIDTLIINCEKSKNKMIIRVLEIAQKKNVGIKSVSQGEDIKIDRNARIYVLYPGNENKNERNKNNSSIVLKVLYGKTSLLLTGDAEMAAEDKIISKYKSFLQSDVLKIAHHGSITATNEELLQKVRPAIALISVGIHNKFNHPSPFTIRKLENHSIDIGRTDKSGAIILETDGNQWAKREWRHRL